MKIKILMLAVLCTVFISPSIVFGTEIEEPKEPEQTAQEPEETVLNEDEVKEVEETEQAEEATDKDDQADVFTFCVYVNDLSDYGLENKALCAKYELDNPMGIASVIEYHEKEILAPNGYRVAVNGLGTKWIEIDGNAAYIFAHPYKKTVQVLHYLTDCNDKVDATFLEKLDVDFLLDLNDKKAVEKIVLTKIEKMNDKGYTYVETKVDDLQKLPHDVKVYDIDGNEVTPEKTLPMIYVLYKRTDCYDETAQDAVKDDAAEQKVDAASIDMAAENNAVLPATGAKDLTAFIMSAVALMGLGVFVTKKH